MQNQAQDLQTIQFVLPKKFRIQTMKACHDEIGHLGIERSLTLLTDQFYWPGRMSDIINKHIKECHSCLSFKTKAQVADLKPLTVTHPLELVHADFLTIEAGKGNKEINVLVITDHFTRYAQAFFTPSKTAQVVARTLWDKYFVHYGLPEKIITDQDCNFESSLMKELCQVAQVKKLRTSLYRPQTNMPTVKDLILH